MSTAAVRISQLEKSFGLSFALGPISLEIPTGVICALVGPNGAGKTTLMNLLMGIGRPDEGAAVLLGHNVQLDEVAVKRRVAFVSPDLDYRAWGTVGRAIDFISAFYPDWNAQRCEKLLFDFGLHRSERIDALSFGAHVKLSVLLALSREPDLLLLDEPTAGLDPLARQLLFTELLKYMQDERRTIVVSSHQLAELERFADHVVMLNAGQIVTFGAIPDVLERYVQLDVVVKPERSLPRTGVHVLARDGNRVRLLVDRKVLPAGIGFPGVEIVGECALTLEELFVALIKGAGVTRRQIRMVAA